MLERFYKSFVVMTHGCWEWTGTITCLGYGQFYTGKKKVSAHILSWSLATQREVPIGFELDHTCRNRGCVNPEHLEVVTHRENVLRGESLMSRNAAKTHCKRGHLLDETNIYQQLFKRTGRRACITCNKMAGRERKNKLMLLGLTNKGTVIKFPKLSAKLREFHSISI